MKTTLKSLEKNLLDLKQDLSKEYGNIIKRLGNLEKAVIDLQKDDAKFLKQQQSRFKVGDYVKVKFDCGSVDCGKIIRTIGLDYEIGFADGTNAICDIEHIIGYAKPDLLTLEEKEYLRAVIKPFRDRIKYIERWNDVVLPTIKYITIYGINKTEVYISILCENKYNNLELGKFYTLEELGL